MLVNALLDTLPCIGWFRNIRSFVSGVLRFHLTVEVETACKLWSRSSLYLVARRPRWGPRRDVLSQQAVVVRFRGSDRRARVHRSALDLVFILMATVQGANARTARRDGRVKMLSLRYINHLMDFEMTLLFSTKDLRNPEKEGTTTHTNWGEMASLSSRTSLIWAGQKNRHW
jgi:hypothetical protein